MSFGDVTFRGFKEILVIVALAAIIQGDEVRYTKLFKKYCPMSTTMFYDTIEEAKRVCSKNSNCVGFQGACNKKSKYDTYETCRKSPISNDTIEEYFEESPRGCSWRKGVSVQPPPRPTRDCRTNGGPSSNAPCIFPFIFKGNTYNQCTLDGEDYWCSTKVDSSGKHIGNQGNWGVCGQGCPGLPGPEIPEIPCGIIPSRIVGGSAAGPYSLPWQVGLLLGSRRPFCGGTLISNRHVLTAAHCTRGLSSFDVVVGEHNTADPGDGTVHKVSRFVEHPRYTRNPPNYDFAIATLKTPVSLGIRANAACLPTPSWGQNFLAGKTMKVSGWGRTSQEGGSPSVLHSVNVPGLTNSQCNRLYDNSITSQMLCAGYVSGEIDSCQGDSGGPLTYRDNKGRTTVVGVVSWGIGCAQKGRPGVYSRVTSVLRWIKNNMN